MISADTRRAPHRSWVLWTVYGALGAVLLAYLVSLLVRGDNSSDLIDGWMVAAFELIGSALCFLRAAGRPGRRGVPLALGFGTLAWALGDVFLTAESAGGAAVPTPSIADIFYLGFYPLVYIGLVLLVRRLARELTSAMWLDGLVAGLGAAGVSACFLFGTLVRATGASPTEVATNLAYPVGDLLLLALVVGVTAVLPGRRHSQWILLALACAINAAGDTANLLRSPGSGWGFATVFDAVAWPSSILLISLALWLPGRSGRLGDTSKPPGMLLPGLGAASGLGILLFGSFHPVSTVAVGLATATLVVVGFRFWLSVGHLRTLTHKRHRQAVTDDLTGLGNRRQLFYMLNDFFTDAADPTTPKRDLGLLFIDLDHFKEINDSFGHSAGDELLRQLGPRLASTLRSTDVLVRVGGDELGVVIMDADVEYATAVARRLIATLEEPFVLDAVSVRISASIGIATAPTDASDSAGLLRCADLAMYRAKLSASTYELYRKEIDDDGSRLRLVEELRGAVQQGQFMLHYQPQVNLRTGDITAIEALLRWPHPRLGLVPPLEFLPLAEEAGLMATITAWVVDEALAQSASWRAGGRDLPVSVNVSVSNLLDEGFVNAIGAALARHHLPGSSLMLEITETTIISDFDGCRRVISELRELGVGVSIDDFGAGFTSLAYLSSLAVSELKLDRGFIKGLIGDTPDRDLALIHATIELGHALGMRVVAEGVEDNAVLEQLRGAGCDVAQGFYISHPMPANDLVLAPVIIAARPQLKVSEQAS
ncbi:MAG: bifunctional diguanylate cyclase/phosphodiesterase [Candidatus Dormibacteraeota bacterium]|nr:bifunctional diguanylate cyclase/phosphodiesterase [Candidatus Dormibacteraeota bacterium]